MPPTSKNSSSQAFQKSRRQSTGIQSLKDILLKYDLDQSGKYITKEFQDYGYRLAVELNDPKHVGMYIKFAKTIDRAILEKARSFIADAHEVKSKARLFMWKLKDLQSKKDS